MKTRLLALPFFLLLFLLNSYWCYSQNNDSEIRINSISTGFDGFYFKKSNYEGGGVSFVLNGTLESNKFG